ncbi:P-loop containing nucleoside triphosphate hydrolase protein [Podospora fimiseda]|uniref:P-loop containing nucleoside triphosphate hydrolase protein n=1 Tax=Podospora fimiseda TaxID=252190 RepID=A0AAN7BS21_9PEZI|nr:P-loop containing nucleoside triphosphate hydrolase protein [Podospora fimiseda]
MSPPKKALIISISGCSSSGKTTLARLLRDIFSPHTFILHQDDFYLPESQLPKKTGTDLLDWDCPSSLDLPLLHKALTHIHSTGTFPPFIDSKEDLNTTGSLPPSITPSLFSSLKPPIISSQKTPICILDGFLLYTQDTSFSSILPLLDIKLFLLATKSSCLQRRQNRDGYVTLEGFWTDPPGYVEQIVWPNYVEYHKWMFKGQEEFNVEKGMVDREIAEREMGVRVQPWKEGEGIEFKEVLEWAVEEVGRGVKEWEEKKG